MCGCASQGSNIIGIDASSQSEISSKGVSL